MFSIFLILLGRWFILLGNFVTVIFSGVLCDPISSLIVKVLLYVDGGVAAIF